MKLYLIQHGEAEKKEVDPERPLTAKGKKDIAKISASLKGSKTAKIYHSGKLRAQQTAELIAPGGRTEARDQLAPNDPLDPILDEIKKSTEDLMIVGHLPFLGKLASLLLTGDQEKNTVSFQQGAVLCLERPAGGNWSILFFITPEQV